MLATAIMTVDERSLGAYQNQVDAMRKSPYLDFPAHVHLETNALCNAACNFCPYPTLERRGTKMPDALITKIIEDLRDIPQTLPFQLSPFKVNEPFLDTRLFSILAQINERLPNASLTLTTNASALTEKQLTQLGGRAQPRVPVDFDERSSRGRVRSDDAVAVSPHHRADAHDSRGARRRSPRAASRAVARRRRELAPISHSCNGCSASSRFSRRASFSAAIG